MTSSAVILSGARASTGLSARSGDRGPVPCAESIRVIVASARNAAPGRDLQCLARDRFRARSSSGAEWNRCRGSAASLRQIRSSIRGVPGLSCRTGKYSAFIACNWTEIRDAPW